jgi:regulator of protease activity HflC (stomatin/prohibitin superfamily)
VITNSEPKLLSPRRKPYVFIDPKFKLITPDGFSLFHDATTQIIKHESIKRIIPHTGQVAVTYNGGQLEIKEAPKDGKAIIIDSPTHKVEGLLDIGIQTLNFPSERKGQRNSLRDEINHLFFDTKDFIKVKVTFSLDFEITTPYLALTSLTKEKIIPHIEHRAMMHVERAIQSRSFAQCTGRTPLLESEEKQEVLNPFSTESPSENLKDEVERNLGKDLKEFGITLLRLQVSTPKPVNSKIKKTLMEESIESAVRARRALSVQQDCFLAEYEARQKVNIKEIALKQENHAKKARAKADFFAAQKLAEAESIKAEVEKKTIRNLGKIYSKSPELVELEKKRLTTSGKNLPHDPYSSSPSTLFGKEKKNKLATKSIEGEPFNQNSL